MLLRDNKALSGIKLMNSQLLRMQKLEPPGKIRKWQIQRGNSTTKVNKTMTCFSTEPLYARSTLSSTEHQKSSLKNNFTRYACYRDTSSGSGNQKLERGQAGRVLGTPILYLPSEVLTHLPCHRLHFLTILESALPKTALPIPSSQKSKWDELCISKVAR